MCLSGGFVLSLFIPGVLMAPVISQPGLPFLSFTRARRAALGVSPADLEEAAASQIPLLGFRFRGDWICPAERFRSVRDRFGDRFEAHELPGSKHSVLTIEFDPDPESDTYKARETLVGFLRKRLF